MKRFNLKYNLTIITFLIFWTLGCRDDFLSDPYLVAYYPFNGNARDSGPNRLNGRVFGASLTTDRFGNANSAYNFDGIDDYIQVVNNPKINFITSQPYTVSLWVKPSLNQADKAGTNNDIISKWNIDAEGYPYAFRVWNSTATPDNRDRFFYLRYDGSNCDYYLEATDNAKYEEKWYNLTMVRSSLGLIQVFRDGIRVHISQDNAICPTSNLDDLSIGRRHTDLRFFTGEIDDIVIYSRELSASEIVSLALDR